MPRLPETYAVSPRSSVLHFQDSAVCCNGHSAAHTVRTCYHLRGHILHRTMYGAWSLVQ